MLSEDELRRLSRHQYRCVNNSTVEPYLEPWFEWCVRRTPASVAPNLLTALGFVANLAPALAIVCHAGAGAAVPGWLFAVDALGIFLYQTLDAMDGKQARRTGSATPLGELLDHGSDALTTLARAMATSVCTGLDRRPPLMAAACVGALVFNCAVHADTARRGEMRVMAFDTPECLVLCAAVSLAAAAFGAGAWTRELFGVASAGAALGAVTIVALCVSRAREAATDTSRKVVVVDRRASSDGLRATAAIATVAVPLARIYVDRHVLLYTAAVGLALAKLANEQIVCYMCAAPVRVASVPLLLLAALTGAGWALGPSAALLRASVALLLIDLVRYVALVYADILRYLNIRLFSLRPCC